MKSKARTVAEYLKGLDEDRRGIIAEVRAVILKNLQEGFEEGMQYGMIGYFVPHRLYPAGYHGKPEEPLPFLSLASQKNHCALYAMSLYADPKALRQFQSDWKKTGRKLDMGKSCIRFKKIEDLALDLIGRQIRSTSVRDFIALYEAQIR